MQYRPLWLYLVAAGIGLPFGVVIALLVRLKVG